MQRLPAVDSICLNPLDTLWVVLVRKRPRGKMLARLTKLVQSQPGVESTRMVYGTKHGVLEVKPAQPAQSLELLENLSELLLPQRTVNVHLYQGTLTKPATTTTEHRICAVEFVLPTPRPVVASLCEQFIEWVEYHIGPATLVKQHERFFIVRFKMIKKGRPVVEILHKDMWLAVSFFVPVSGHNNSGITTTTMVALLDARHR